MRSEKKIKTKLNEIKVDPTSEELEKLEGGHMIKVEGKKLIFEENPRVKRRDTEVGKRELKERARGGSLTMDDVAQFITNYL